MNELERKIAEDICTLNRWQTPLAIKEKVGRDLRKEETSNVMRALEAYVPYDKWIKVWNEPRAQREEMKPTNTVAGYIGGRE